MDNQLQDLHKFIGSEYDHVAAGREDGDKQGEVATLPILSSVVLNRY